MSLSIILTYVTEAYRVKCEPCRRVKLVDKDNDKAT